MTNKERPVNHNKIAVEGNLAGDFLEIVDQGNDTVHIKCGHCCVIVLDAVVPVEFLTALIFQAMINHDDNISAVIDTFDWSDKYKNQLKAKVKRLD
jgi:hypothetical protein